MGSSPQDLQNLEFDVDPLPDRNEPRPEGVDPEVHASSPGRVEFIGNHTDYNGGSVLGATINRRVHVGLTYRNDSQIRLESAADVPQVLLDMDRIEAQAGERAWANYVLGTLQMLREEGLSVDSGFTLRVESTLPVGAGLSSSAALELATAFALTEAFDGNFDRITLTRLARRAENEFVGVPCGLLDQAVVAFGGAGRLVRLDTKTEDISTVPFPKETKLWVFLTHQTHALAEDQYQERHDEAHAARDQLKTLVDGVDHLADISPSQLEAVRKSLPDLLYRRSRHVSTEHRRVQRVARLLEKNHYEAAGKLLFASHESSRSDYENSTPELDFIVEQLMGTPHVLGARLTGAGFGGAVMAWTRDRFGQDEANSIRQAYREQFGSEIDALKCHLDAASVCHSHA
jgi:galactokinase